MARALVTVRAVTVVTVPYKSIQGQRVRPILVNKSGSIYFIHVMLMCIVVVAIHPCDNPCVNRYVHVDLELMILHLDLGQPSLIVAVGRM